MAGIEIPLGAPLDQLIKDFGGAKKLIKQFEDQVNNTLPKVGSGLKRSTQDFQKWNRVIQDSPYGIQGISNNLQELIPNIGIWSIALNVALTALTFLQVGTSNWTRGLKDNKKAVDSAKLSGDDYIKTLDQVKGAQLSGAIEAQKEVTTLDLLYRQYQNANLPLKERKEAYKQLQELYPSYFKNIKFEQEASDRTKKAYDELRTAIIATARARAAADKITQNETRRLENEQKIVDLRKEETKLQDQANAKQKSRGTGAGQGFGGSQNQSIALQNLNDQSKINDVIRQRNNLITDNNKLDALNLTLIKSVNQEIAKGASLTGKIGAEGKTDKVTRNFLDRIPDTVFKRFSEGVTIKTQESLKKAFAEIDPTIKFPIEQILDTNALFSKGEIFKEYISYDLLPQLGQNFEMFFNDILTKGKLSFDSLGKAILNTFASVLASEATQGVLNLLGQKGGPAKKSGGGLLGAIGGIFGLGKAAGIGAGAASSTGAVAAGTAASGGLLLPILGGIAAVGGILSLFKKKKKPADVPVPSTYNPVTATSVNAPTDISGGRVVFEISGTNLIGVLNRAGYKLSRYGI